MAFSRPTLQQLIERIGTDLKTRLGLSGAVLRRSVVGILAHVYAATVHSLYGYLDTLARQAHPLTAEGQFLDRWGSLWKITRKPAGVAGGVVTFNGANGSVILSGTILQRADGVEYKTNQGANINTGIASVSVSAIEGGTTSNAQAGTRLSLISPISGVQTVAVIDSNGLVNGSDIETDTDLRARLIARIQTPPQGGTIEDYRQWALSVPGVTRAFVFENYLGGGTVGVSFVTDNATSIIPDFSKVAEVRAVVEMNRPLMVDVSVFAPINVGVNFTIRLSPNVNDVQQAVRNELQDLFRRESQPGHTILLSHINEAISIAAGEVDHVLVLPASSIVLAENEIATLGNISWGSIL